MSEVELIVQDVGFILINLWLSYLSSLIYEFITTDLCFLFTIFVGGLRLGVGG